MRTSRSTGDRLRLTGDHAFRPFIVPCPAPYSLPASAARPRGLGASGLADLRATCHGDHHGIIRPALVHTTPRPIVSLRRAPAPQRRSPGAPGDHGAGSSDAAHVQQPAPVQRYSHIARCGSSRVPAPPRIHLTPNLLPSTFFLLMIAERGAFVRPTGQHGQHGPPRRCKHGIEEWRFERGPPVPPRYTPAASLETPGTGVRRCSRRVGCCCLDYSVGQPEAGRRVICSLLPFIDPVLHCHHVQSRCQSRAALSRDYDHVMRQQPARFN